MKIKKLNNMVKGWFMGNFTPTAYRTKDVEVAVKKYKAKEKETTPHYHKLATEITLIISGKVRLNKKIYSEGDIIIIEPFEPVKEFIAIKDTVTVVVKIPGANDDKYPLVE